LSRISQFREHNDLNAFQTWDQSQTGIPTNAHGTIEVPKITELRRAVDDFQSDFQARGPMALLDIVRSNGRIGCHGQSK